MNKPFTVTDSWFERKFWYNDEEGFLHCENGPAEEYIDGRTFWFKHGRRHRANGPAVVWHHIYPQLKDEYWYEGCMIECDTDEEFQTIVNLRAFW